MRRGVARLGEVVTALFAICNKRGLGQVPYCSAVGAHVMLIVANMMFKQDQKVYNKTHGRHLPADGSSLGLVPGRNGVVFAPPRKINRHALTEGA